jgi:putative ABC transport system ATP-binding protein
MPESPVVEARGLVKTYHKGQIQIRVLNGLDLEVPRGELLALMGPSGSGKSTLLHVIGGIDRADAGTCLVAGHDVGTMDEKQLSAFRASRIGFVFQVYNLIPVLTARENVELPLRLFPIPAARRRAQAATALSIVGLDDRADHLPGQLSGGQEQRVAIARALATDPQIILADEPTGDLDEEAGDEVMAILRGLSREHGKTVIMVTHDAARAATADRILHFDHGRLSDASPRDRRGRG